MYKDSFSSFVRITSFFGLEKNAAFCLRRMLNKDISERGEYSLLYPTTYFCRGCTWKSRTLLATTPEPPGYDIWKRQVKGVQYVLQGHDATPPIQGRPRSPALSRLTLFLGRSRHDFDTPSNFQIPNYPCI